MDFTIKRMDYNGSEHRAYVELRAPDSDGKDAILPAIFHFRSDERISREQVKKFILDKARKLCVRASVAK